MPIQRPVLGIDIDGVLADFNTAFYRLLTGDTWKQGFVPTVWDWPTDEGFSADQIDAAWAAVTCSHSFWGELSAYPGAVGVLEDLSWMQSTGGGDVYFVTARSKGFRVKNQTEDWLTRHGFKRPTVLVTPTKGQVAAALGVTHFLDDHWANCQDVQTHHNGQVYLLDQPWNRADRPVFSGIKRVTSLQQFLREVPGVLSR